MLKPWRRMATGGVKSLKDSDHTYFTGHPGAVECSHFREDARAIVGGALAAAIIATAVISIVQIPLISESVFTFIAAFAGGIAGKIFIA